MITQTETLQYESAKTYGVKSRYHLRKVDCGEPTVVKPFDREKFEAYKAAHPLEFTESARKQRERDRKARERADNKTGL